jgi:aminomethyltransferase
MSSTAMTQTPLRTPLHRFHVEHGAKLVEFAGWEMPMLYRSILEEHRQVRQSGGIFDVSHMGRLRFTGKEALRFLDRVCTRQILGMSDGQVRYSLVCNEAGGCRDDVLVYRLAEREYVMVCNAANRAKLLEHFAAHRRGLDLDMRDETVQTAMVAIQGPRVIELFAALASGIEALKRYRFLRKDIMGAAILISRTGYTGEDGVEVIMPASIVGPALGLLGAHMQGENAPIRPAGLGARDTLRMEAGMPLYGHEITEELDPLSAGLDFAVALDKSGEAGTFIGQEALKRLGKTGLRRKLAGLVLEGKRTARQGMTVQLRGKKIGEVTSACLSPTLEKPIAMAYLATEHTAPGTRVDVALGSANVPAEVTALPFYNVSRSA